MPQLWEIIGGVEKGGIIVRRGKDLESPEEASRLSVGSIVEETEVDGVRLCYRLRQGNGPNVGWISTCFKGNALVQQISAAGDGAFYDSRHGGIRLSVTKMSGAPIGRFVLQADAPFSDLSRRVSSITKLPVGSCQLVHGSTILDSLTTCLEAGVGDDANVILLMRRKMLLTGSQNGEAQLWDIETGDCMKTLVGDRAGIFECSFSKDGSLILTTSGGRRAHASVWSAITGEHLSTLQASNGAIESAMFSPSGARVLTCGRQELSMWDVAQGCCCLWTVHPGCRMAAFAPDGGSIVTSRISVVTDGENVRKQAMEVLDTTCGRRIALVGDLTGSAEPNCIGFSPRETRVLVSPVKGNAVLWNTQEGETSGNQILHGHKGLTTFAGFSPDGTMVVTGSQDSTAKLWNAMTCECWRTLHCHDGDVSFATFSPDGQQVLTMSRCSIRLWDVTTGWRLQKVLMPHQHYDVAFDGIHLITATGGECSSWDKDSGKLIQAFLAKNVVSCAIAPYH